jgi:AraC-like DNA-binding protein
MSQLVRAATLSNYALIARQFGLEPESMLRQHGLDPRCLDNADLRIPATAVVELLEDSAAISGCTSFGLRMAESRHLSDFGSLSLLFRHQTTLRAALDLIRQYRQQLNDALSVHLEQHGDSVILREELRTPTDLVADQATELAIGVMFRLLRALMGAQWHCSGVHFKHAAPSNCEVHRRVFGLDVTFSSKHNSIIFPAADLDRPKPDGDPILVRYARQLVDASAMTDAESVITAARNTLQQFLPLGQGSIRQVAQNLGIDVRTLQRRLDKVGLSFTALQTSVRRELVQRYLDDHRYTLQQITQMLGFSAPSVFSRWFHSQYGMAPRQWRKTQILQGN